MSSNENKPSRFASFFGRRAKVVEQPEPSEEARELEALPEEVPEETPEELAGAASEPAPDTGLVSEENLTSEDIYREQTPQEPEAFKQDTSEEEVGQDDSAEQDSSEQPVSSDEKIPEKQSGGLFSRWRTGLKKTSQQFGSALGGLLRNRTQIDSELLEEIETQLLVADVGLKTTEFVIESLQARVKKIAAKDLDLYQELKTILADILESGDRSLNIEAGRTNVVMMVGVNGVGKTTSIGKLANQLKSEGHSLVLAAGDTFRAAAVEQLQVWGKRNDISVVAQSTGADSASVIYDALESGRARNTDIVIADTAGRLHNKSNLMEELGKVVRVIKKQDDSAPHETLLVLDACTGQNAINQAEEFAKAVPLTGIILTKMDGTAKGGVIFSLVQQTGLPVKYVGLGEGIHDLAAFDPKEFVNALFDVAD